MIVTVLWEDQRGVGAKGYAPHSLLIACVRDRQPALRDQELIGIPCKGNGGVKKKLIHDNRWRGPVVGVLDFDQAHLLWRPPAPKCKLGVRAKLIDDGCSRDHHVVFLVENMETLLRAACSVLSCELPNDKPNPDQRDVLLHPLLSSSRTEQRAALVEGCPSFAYLVSKVAGLVGLARRR